MEAFVRAERPAAVVESDGTLAIFVEGALREASATLLKVAQQFQLPPSSIRIHAVPEFPRTPHGKIAYSVLLSAS